MSAADPPFVAPPPAPASVAESGLNVDLLIQLALKTLHLAGTLTGLDLSSRLGVPFSVIEPALDELKWQHHCEIVSGSILGGPAFRYRITDKGRERAALFLQNNHYVGVAPVPLAQYSAYMERFREAVVNDVSPSSVRSAFEHLVLSDRVLDQLGPAVRAGRSLFIYGPPGNGKTVIAQAIGNLLGGDIAIPHALEVEGAIIRFYDPVSHCAVPAGGREDEPPRLDLGAGSDRRWIRCRRPAIMAGGELTLDGLEVRYTPSAGFYRAPIQAIANGGILVIDDFGRQHCSPHDLLNRWIVPLETGHDYLTLQTGLKFDIPFAAFVIFATNIRPTELVDEAFLRRIQYKVFAESPTRADFIRIFENYCRSLDLPFDAALVEQMLEDRFRPRGVALRGCQPRDLVNQALAMAEYRGHPRQLTSELLTAACDGYFVDDVERAPEYA